MNTAISTASGRRNCRNDRTDLVVNDLILISMEKELVLKTMREAGKPVAAGEVATLSGLDRKVVDKVFAELKKDGTIVSPVRCKWTPAQ